MTFPINENMIFMLCDDFRHEGGGKMSMFGMLGDNMRVNLPKDQNIVTLSSLGIYVAFKDGIGNFKMNVSLKSPDNKELIPQVEPQSVKKERAEGWMNVALKLSPFRSLLGKHILKVKLKDAEGGEAEYIRTFNIDREPTKN
ncbi:MAG: hypothetical protein AWT59_3218 [Candidatus Gallionella acididurans]|uniref:Uncharacterized protein n=1 Tax=Candidatus Gallionella acididurans TaxID=1796491 RepID=A0A139BPC0_9PROT|nr:MAG: hypothetical protein AWT59_3218 [Candidatus Gallionella acididurans]